MATKKAETKTSPSGVLYRHSTRSVILEIPLAVAKDVVALMVYMGTPGEAQTPASSPTQEASCAKIGRLLSAAIKHAATKGAR